MAVEVKVPVLAESVAQASILKWHKKPGDTVKRGDSLTDIETDKVTLEVAAPNSGTLLEILKDEGADVSSNEVIARIETAMGQSPANPAAEETIETSPATAEPVVEPPAEQEKVPPSPATVAEATRESREKPAGPSETEPSSARLSPAVKHLITSHQLDEKQLLSHLGKDRITKEDVLQYLDDQKESGTAGPAATPTAPDIAAESTDEESLVSPVDVVEVVSEEEEQEERMEKRVPMTRLRKRIAERLLGAQHENAILTTFNEVNMQPILDIRKRYKEEFEKAHGVKLGFMSFFTKASIEALKKFPIINASVDGDDIIYHGYFDIGIAVSSPRGLVVPILRDADSMSFADIETGINTLAEKAQDSKLGIEELTGGTFTITNGGVFGSLLSTPIINPPQSAILGMHKMQERPIAVAGKVVVRPMMYLALSYDHRIIDGREAVQFLVSIKEQLEDPARLLLQV